MPQKPKHGGRRPGAGRPQKLGSPLIRRDVRLTQAQLDFIEKLDGTDFSDRIRKLIDKEKSK